MHINFNVLLKKIAYILCSFILYNAYYAYAVHAETICTGKYPTTGYAIMIDGVAYKECYAGYEFLGTAKTTCSACTKIDLNNCSNKACQDPKYCDDATKKCVDPKAKCRNDDDCGAGMECTTTSKCIKINPAGKCGPITGDHCNPGYICQIQSGTGYSNCVKLSPTRACTYSQSTTVGAQQVTTFGGEGSCDAGYYCSNAGKCTAGSKLGASCKSSGECGNGRDCVANKCVDCDGSACLNLSKVDNRCKKDEDCVALSICKSAPIGCYCAADSMCYQKDKAANDAAIADIQSQIDAKRAEIARIDATIAATPDISPDGLAVLNSRKEALNEEFLALTFKLTALQGQGNPAGDGTSGVGGAPKSALAPGKGQAPAGGQGMGSAGAVDTSFHLTIAPGHTTCLAQGDCTLDDLVNTAADFANLLTRLAGALFFLAFIYGGFLYLTSFGDQSKVSEGKKAITTACIGIVIVMCAWVIVQFVKSTLGAQL